jgi:hypothetical protein
MSSIHNLSSGLSAILYLSTVPIVGALTIGAKLAYLVPLLIKWNNPHLSSTDKSMSSRPSPFQSKNGKFSLPYTLSVCIQTLIDA